MTESSSFITIMTCRNGAGAAKKFSMAVDGKIKKISFQAGKFFNFAEVPVTNLEELSKVLDALSLDPKKFVIRGKPKNGLSGIVRRKMHDPGAAFEAVARPYLMLDIDKLVCPEYFDPVANAEEIIRWIQNTLPEPFQDKSCHYRFSSSQNVFMDGHKKSISVHLWFWCDRPVLEEEWKRYFRTVSSPVDQALFSPVQIHYTASPLFENMEDPLSIRSGIFTGASGSVTVPQIPVPDPIKSNGRSKIRPVIDAEKREEAMNLLLAYYKEGSRNNFCAALAATLYREGWAAEDSADFVHELAENAGDEEADNRYDNALRVCEAVDRNLPAPGIPTLKNIFLVKNLKEILLLLKGGESDLESILLQLNNGSTENDIRVVLRALLGKPESEQEFYIDKIKNRTKASRKALGVMLDEVAKEESLHGPADWPDEIVKSFLQIHYKGGKHFLRSSDKRYWRYNQFNWEVAPDDFVGQQILRCARDAKLENGLKVGLSPLLDASLNILQGEAYERCDPFKLVNRDMPLVINCRNGELWFDEQGEVTLKPHRADSYLRNCLNVDYSPSAICPEFDCAVLEIFSESSDPVDMHRHFMELAGYICQPWRKLPIIVLLYGGGANGKSSLIKILCKVLGTEAVMSGRINEISKDKFKIGDLDGKLMLYEDDVATNTRLDDGFLKTIGEQKPLTGEQKYKPSYLFMCRAVPVMLANGYPSISDLTEGLRRRLIVVPFDRQFKESERDLELFDRIWEKEASGILNHFVSGFQRLKRRGHFLEPVDCIVAKNKWITRSNILPTFIEECCRIGEGYGQSLKDFYGILREYCDETGYTPVPRQQWIRSRLESLGYEISVKDGQPYVRGIMAVSQLFGAVVER